MGVEITAPQIAQQQPWRLPLHLKPVPATHGWPLAMEGPTCWDSTTFAREENVILCLTEEEVAEVEAAVEHFNELGLYGSEVAPATFPLPTLGPKLYELADDIHSGKGFAAIRGLKPENLCPEDSVIVFLGVSSYIGSQRGRQDEDGNMLMHIRDAKSSTTAQENRPIRYSRRASKFHTDAFCDILALHVIDPAYEGGENLLASSWTVYNKLKADHPEVCDLLAQPIWPFDSRGKFLKSSTRPLLFHQNNRILMNFAREPLLGLKDVKRAAHLPSLTQDQQDALDLVEKIATENQLSINSAAGDLLFINNHCILHSREEFRDAPRDLARKVNPRYLIRAWLKNPGLAWQLPRHLQEGSARIYDENELGEQWNIVDVPKVQFRLSERLTS